MATVPKARLTAGLILLVIVFVAAHAVFSVFRIVTTTAPDFFYYYQASQSFISHVENPLHLLPPASLLVYAPLAVLPYPLVQGAWIIVSVACLVFVVRQLGALVGVTSWQHLSLMGVLAYAMFPTRFTLGMGQVNLIALAFVVYAVALVRKNQAVLPGILFAYAMLLKPELVLLLPVMVWARKWPLLVIISGVLIITEFVARGLVYEGAQYIGIESLFESFIRGWASAGVYYNQGLSGLLVRAGFIQPWVYGVLSVFVLIITLIARIKRPLPFEALLWSSLPVLILVEPIAWQHHLVFLLPTLFWLWKGNNGRVRKAVLMLGFVLLSWNFATPGFLDTMPLGWLVASHATVGVIMLWVLTL